MENNWALMASVEQKERESQGFLLIKDDIIKCANCGIDLLCVLKVKDENVETAIRVDCPYCGDGSFWYKISGKIYIQAAEGLSIKDMPINIRNGIRFTDIKVIKHG